MRYYSQETGRGWYLLDLASYLLLSLALAGLLLQAPASQQLPIWLAIIAGLIGWSLLEYLLHRYLLHGPPPFLDWHRAHHQRPRALLGTPTAISLGLILLLAFAPAWLLLGRWPATALLFGLVLGYLNYSWLHQRLHRPGRPAAWLRHSHQNHARHHQRRDAGLYGVSTAVWDRVFGTRLAPLPSARAALTGADGERPRAGTDSGTAAPGASRPRRRGRSGPGPSG